MGREPSGSHRGLSGLAAFERDRANDGIEILDQLERRSGRARSVGHCATKSRDRRLARLCEAVQGPPKGKDGLAGGDAFGSGYGTSRILLALYDDPQSRAADVAQLEQIAGTYKSRAKVFNRSDARPA